MYKYNLCYVKYTIKTNINPFTFKLSQKNFLAFIFCFTNVGICLSLRINNAYKYANLMETVGLSIITGPKLGKQNFQTKEVCVQEGKVMQCSYTFSACRCISM